MIIDFRVRPPFGSFLKLVIHSDHGLSQFESRNGVAPPRSAFEHSMELFMSELQDANIEVGVVVGRNTPTHGAIDNADIAALVAMQPERFVGFGGIDVSNSDSALNEYRRCIGTLGLTGVAFDAGFSSPPRHVDDAQIYPLYETCQSEGVPIAITYGAGTGPDVEYSNPVHVDHVASDFPRLRLVVAHGAWPWAAQMVAVARNRRNVSISPDVFAVGMPGSAEYTLAAEKFLRHQYIYASSYPLLPLGSCLAAFRSLPMKPETMERALWRNAAELLLSAAKLPAQIRNRLESAI